MGKGVGRWHAGMQRDLAVKVKVTAVAKVS